MRIFHFSDIHWHERGRQDVKVIIDACVSDLRSLVRDNDHEDSVIVFTGDLVMAGENAGDFENAFSETVGRIAQSLGIDFSRVIICPGNHDMSRKSARGVQMLERSARETLIDRATISTFVDNVLGDFEKEMLLERTENFYCWHDSRFPSISGSGPFYRTAKVTIAAVTYGFAIFNSAFRSIGEGEDSDNGYLLIGEHNILRALDDLQDCDHKIFLSHHPIELLQEVDRSLVRTKLDKEFVAHLFGHMHTADPIVFNRPLGTVLSAQGGSLYASRDWFNGYQIIDLDLISGDVSLNIREYQPKLEQFDAATSVARSGLINFKLPVGDDRESSVARVLRTLRETVRTKALAHIDFADLATSQCEAILEAEALPVLYRRRLETDEDGAEVRERRELSQLGELIERSANAYLHGPPQSGRTALAHALAIKFTEAGPAESRIPIILSKDDLFKRLYEIRRALVRYAELSVTDAELEKLLKVGAFVFIVDDMNFANVQDLEKFKKFTELYGKNKWIAIGHRTSEGVAAESQLRKGLPGFDVYEIGTVPRKAIRRLSHALSADANEGNLKFDLAMSQIKSESLPRSPYIAMLLIWANRQRLAGRKLNEALLLQNVLEHLLGRADFRTTRRGDLGAVGKEIVLQFVAEKLTAAESSIPENDLLRDLVEFFSDRRLPFMAGDVLEKLVGCGILDRRGDEVGFKYDSFRKYFFATSLRDDPDKLRRAIDGLSFIKFKSELELLAGLRLKNDDLIERIASVIENRGTDRLAKSDARRLIDPADITFLSSSSQRQIAEIKRKRLSQGQVDDMLDRLDGKAEQRGEIGPSKIVKGQTDVQAVAKDAREKGFARDVLSDDAPLSLQTYMSSLRLLGRIVRSSDFSAYDKKGPAAAYVVEGFSRMYLSLMDEMSSILDEVVEGDGQFSKQDVSFIKYKMGKLIFQLLGHVCVDCLSSPVLGDTIEGVLSHSEDRPGVRLMCLFLVEDCNSEAWASEWSAFIANPSITKFEIENLIERLYEAVQVKALDPEQSDRFTEIGEQLEKRFDWSQAQSNSFRASLSRTRSLEVIKDQAGKR